MMIGTYKTRINHKPLQTIVATISNIYILSVVALHESNISSCLHFSMQNIEKSYYLDRASMQSNVNVSQ